MNAASDRSRGEARATVDFRPVTDVDRAGIVAARPDVDAYFDQRIDRDRTGRTCWFAAVDGAADILGWVILHWGSASELPAIEDLYVVEARRNDGVGTQLVVEAERLARVSGSTAIRLAVNPTKNAEARRLYERLGYVHDGGPPYLDGVYDGHEDWVIDMTKTL